MMSRTNRFLFIIVCALFNACALLKSSIILHGDPNASANQSFSFPISAHATTDSTFYVGALNSGAQDFALARVGKFELQFLPLTPAQVSLNGVPGSENPLYNQGIQFLDVLSVAQGSGIVERAVVVTNNPAQKSNLYLVDRASDKHVANVLAVEDVTDANGLTSNGILGVAATSGGRSGAFAAVLPNGGSSFGVVGSGIALANLNELKVDGVTSFVVQQLAANPASSFMAAAPFDVTSSFIAIGSTAVAMTNIVDLHWSTFLQRLYVVVQVTGGAGATDGAYAVAVGQVNKDGKLLFQPIAPSSIFTAGAQNEIVGGIASSAQTSFSKVKTMHSSMGLDYLIVVGGNGSPSATQQEVFALPVINTSDVTGAIQNTTTQGTLADVNATPLSIFTPDLTPTFRWREITQPATNPSQIYTTSSPQAMVGAGSLSAGPIIDLLIEKDTVYAVVGTAASASELPGIFYSQALFDSYGRISNWTPWQRVAGNDDAMFGMSFDLQFGDITFMTGTSSATIQNVQRTQWSVGDPAELQLMGQMLEQELPSFHGGIQGFVDFPLNTPGLVNISALLATGFQKVVLVESGFVNGSGAYVANGGNFVQNKQSFYNGIISPSAHAQVLSITGGALDSLSSIVTGEIGVDTVSDNGWLFVGGDGGLAVLANADGSGWNASTGLAQSFVGLTNNMAFKMVGSYSFVRSLIADNNFLYVLTDKQLDRIDLNASNFGTGTLVKTTVASAQVPSVFGGNGTLLSMVISGKFAVLATSQGLFRVGNNADISTATSAKDVTWTPVTINEGAGSASQLIALSATGLSQDVARNNGGNLYVLNGFVGLSRGQINRFAVADVSSTPISDTTLVPIPDIRVVNIPSYFRNFGTYANQYATDGSVNLFTRNHEFRRPSFLRNSQRGTARNDIHIPLNIPEGANIAKIVRNSASGSWMVFGDFARFNE